MSQRVSTAVAGACVVVAVAAVGWGLRQRSVPDPFQQKRIALLESEVRRLQTLAERREQADSAPLVAAKRGEIERTVEEIRGLKFLEPVRYDMLDRAGIGETLRRKLEETLSDQDFRGMALGLHALGLLEPGYGLKDKYISLLGEQVAAFYDQHSHTLYMFEDASLENAQNQVILAHELMHALQDQHFSLKKLPLEIKHNDDLAFAASALVEGEATVVMTDFLLRNLSWRIMRDSLAGMVLQNMDQLQTAPRFLREMLLFPYLRGQEFAMALQAHGGYEALTEAYADPPKSTAQILHPELFMGQRVDPIEVQWPSVEVNGAAPASDNVLGEMGMRIMLSESVDGVAAERAAAGWAGDRYLVYGNDAEWHLLWKTLWRTPEDAEEFAAALQSYAGKRYGNGSGRATRIVRGEGNAVTWIDAGSDAWAGALEKTLP